MIPAREVRFVLVVDDLEAAVHLYRDVLGLEVLQELEEGRGRGIILKVPAATMEVVDPEHEGMVDEIEVGRRVGERLRIAVRVDDLSEAARLLVESRAAAMAGPVETPWGDRNQRFRARDGLQLTLFQRV
jgi:catechol 2,3-dioxygenase-like lactoylglutathione lyase family enzyme